MEHRKQLRLALVAAFALSAGSAYADNARREIQTDYRRFTAAETSRQYDRIKQMADAFFTPTFTLKTGKNTLNYAQFLMEMKATANEIRTVQENTFRTRSLRRQGNSLLESGVYTFSHTAIDPDGDFGAKGLMHRINFQTTYQSVWVNIGGRLRLQSLQFVDRHEVVDGKLLP